MLADKLATRNDPVVKVGGKRIKEELLGMSERIRVGRMGAIKFFVHGKLAELSVYIP